MKRWRPPDRYPAVTRRTPLPLPVMTKRSTDWLPAPLGAWCVLAIILVLASAGCAVGGARADADARTSTEAAQRAGSAVPSPPTAQEPRAARVVIRHVVLSDGHLLTVARFTGAVRFVLHCGSSDPGSSCQGLPGRPR